MAAPITYHTVCKRRNVYLEYEAILTSVISSRCVSRSWRAMHDVSGPAKTKERHLQDPTSDPMMQLHSSKTLVLLRISLNKHS